MSGTAIVVPAVHPWFRSTSRMLKKPPVLASLVGLVGFLGLRVERFELGGSPAAALGVYCAAGGHQVAASAMSLGSRTRL